MKFELRLLNCLWLLIPLLIWNIILGPKLNDPRLTADINSPAWQLIAENASRILVFALPLIIPMQLKDSMSKAGLIVYGIGTLIYFSTWLPLMLAPQSAWSLSAVGALAPFVTPLAVFMGIALIGHSWLYAVISLVFIFLHTFHGIQNL
ncbi:MAG: hypothetical protein ISR58_18235 [Anaerolineales bacterium]|nr:hypothetical protein [Chloroflexota bacterium]MBL6983118.1 hypothetical protein [Anaerolineales bacterium]